MIRLLYIDDNTGMLEIVKFCIEADPNIRVDTVHSSREGLEVLEMRVHDGVLVDLRMSGLDGLAVLEEVRAKYGDLPVALLGTAPESAIVIKALNAGADLFLNKGVGLVTELDDAVQRMVGLVEQRRTRREHEERRRELERWADNIAEMVLCTDLQLRITSVNQVTCRHLGCDKAELVGKPLASMVVVQDRVRTFLELDNFISGFRSAPVRFRMEAMEEGCAWMEAGVSHLVDDSGPAGLVLSLRKVAEQVRMEEQGQDQSRRMDMVLNMTRHEVDHKVQVAESYLELLRDNVTEKHRRRYLEKALKNVREISRQMHLLQEYQEVGAGEQRWTELGALMEKARGLVGPSQVDMQHDLQGLEVLADPLLESALTMFLEQEIGQSGTTRLDVMFQIGSRKLSLLIDDDAPGIKDERKASHFELDARSRQSQVLHLLREVLHTSDMSISERGLPSLGRRYEIMIPEGRFRFQEPAVSVSANYSNNAARPAS